MELMNSYGEGSGIVIRTCGKIISKLDLVISMTEKKGQRKRLKKLKKKTKKLKKCMQTGDRGAVIL